MRRRCITVGVIISGLFLLGQARAAEPVTPEASVASSSPTAMPRAPAVIQTSPGGGDMVLTRPELGYVTRGRLDPRGRLTTECGHEDETEAGVSAGVQHTVASPRHASVRLRVSTPNALPIVIGYSDTADAGFFDPTLGPARRSAFEFAVNIWASYLAGDVPITVAASMPALGGSGGSALLASAAAVSFHRNFSGGLPGTWYAAALANELGGYDVNGSDNAEISITFNADVDGPEVLGSIGWYYGTDAQPGSDIDFVTIALHELGHGLGFADLVDTSTGSWLVGDQTGIFDRMLLRPLVGPFADLLDAERLAAIVSDSLFWDAPAVAAFNGGPAALYAPDPVILGSSVSHWDPAADPHELMGPFYDGAVHEPGLLLPALMDMGWSVIVPTPTPRASPATPTPTATPRPTLPPVAGTPPQRLNKVYVTDFDGDAVFVIDSVTEHVTTTIAVEDAPLGIAASADGRRIYVANFGAGTVSVVSTRTNRVLATITVGTSANGVAVTPDGAFLVVTDTASDRAAIIDTAANAVTATVIAGPQPCGVAIDPDSGYAFVADYGALTLAVIDIGTKLRRAIIPLNAGALSPYAPGLLSVAIAPGTAASFATTYFPGSVIAFEASAMRMKEGASAVPYLPSTQIEIEAVVFSPDGSRAYVSAHGTTGFGQVLVDLNTTTNLLWSSVSVGKVPQGLAFSPDGQLLYVANSGSDSISVLKPRQGVVATMWIDAAPASVAVAAVPQFCDGDCNGDGAVTVDEVIQAVGIALGQQAVATCIAADADDDDTVTVDEVLRGVNNALDGCHS
jgi:YVTN family beta-propeller protein